MLIKVPPRWQIPESSATPEGLWRRRRQILKALGLGGALIGIAGPADAGLRSALFGPDKKAFAKSVQHLPALPAFGRNHSYDLSGQPLTAELLAGSFNNFYEFSSSKDDVAAKALSFQPRPWSLEIAGLVGKPKTWDLDALVKAFPLEERLYRFRCVETWAMRVPWIGIALAKVLQAAEPRSEARYLRFFSLNDPERFPEQRSNHLAPWPYREGLRLDEAMNELAFLAVGIYGHALPNQHGAPLRLVVPWKYGFKNAKSIVKIELTRAQPRTFWNDAAPEEYGFYGTVNPNAPHPRWSQKSERLLGEGGRVPTRLFNGYAEQVASLYKGAIPY